MPWPQDDLVRTPDPITTSDEYIEALNLANPGITDVNTRGYGPSGKAGAPPYWEKEAIATDQFLPANFRVTRLTIPPIFPNCAEDMWEQKWNNVWVAGLAAVSEIGAYWLMAGWHLIRQADRVVVVPLTEGNPSYFPSGYPSSDPRGDFQQAFYHHRHTKHVPLVDGGNGVPFKQTERALRIGHALIHNPADETEMSIIIHHCAWGCGRTGMAMAMYQLFNNLYGQRNTDQFQAYINNNKTYPPSHENRTAVVQVYESAPPARRIIRTTPGVALAISQIRRLTDPALPAVEHEWQIRHLEKMEARLNSSFFNHLQLKQREVKYSILLAHQKAQYILNQQNSELVIARDSAINAKAIADALRISNYECIRTSNHLDIFLTKIDSIQQHLNSCEQRILGIIAQTRDLQLQLVALNRNLLTMINTDGINGASSAIRESQALQNQISQLKTTRVQLIVDINSDNKQLLTISNNLKGLVNYEPPPPKTTAAFTNPIVEKFESLYDSGQRYLSLDNLKLFANKFLATHSETKLSKLAHHLFLSHKRRQLCIDILELDRRGIQPTANELQDLTSRLLNYVKKGSFFDHDHVIAYTTILEVQTERVKKDEVRYIAPTPPSAPTPS